MRLKSGLVLAFALLQLLLLLCEATSKPASKTALTTKERNRIQLEQFRSRINRGLEFLFLSALRSFAVRAFFALGFLFMQIQKWLISHSGLPVDSVNSSRSNGNHSVSIELSKLSRGAEHQCQKCRRRRQVAAARRTRRLRALYKSASSNQSVNSTQSTSTLVPASSTSSEAGHSAPVYPVASTSFPAATDALPIGPHGAMLLAAATGSNIPIHHRWLSAPTLVHRRKAAQLTKQSSA